MSYIRSEKHIWSKRFIVLKLMCQQQLMLTSGEDRERMSPGSQTPDGGHSLRKGLRTKQTINCSICLERKWLMSGGQRMYAGNTKQQPNCYRGLWSPYSASLPKDHQEKWQGVCLLSSFLNPVTESCQLQSWPDFFFSTGIHGENPGWIQSCLPFQMCKTAGDRRSGFKQIN